ncbi:hypothetical protein [Pontibacter pamirensis]|uniref:hypothetical protein n=1 Tax=Pontibacter pamirensis TaxID=2562824 RepID=UPI001F395B1A|nr:hypothetical protein [Pontibacter pamirensis]
MAPDKTEYADLLATWPAPVQLTHPGGEVFVTISIYQNHIEARWSGHVTADNVVTAAKVYLSLLHKTPRARLLNDKTDATGDWTEANDWLEFEWLPKAIQAGLHAIAYVYSTNMFSRLSSRDLIQRMTPIIWIKDFNDRALAETWLLSHYVPDEAIEP